MAKLFEYAILFHPKVVKDASGNETQGPDKILKAPTALLAGTEKEVSMWAAREIPEEYLDKLEEVEICVRPFQAQSLAGISNPLVPNATHRWYIPYS